MQAELQGHDTSVSDHSIRRFLSKSGLHERKPRRTTLLKEKHENTRLEFAKMRIDNPQVFWEHVLWTDETKLKLFGNAHKL